MEDVHEQRKSLLEDRFLKETCLRQIYDHNKRSAFFLICRKTKKVSKDFVKENFVLHA